MAEYHRLVAATGPVQTQGSPGDLTDSFGALVKDYLASPEFKGRKPSTQKIYRLVLEPLAELHGPKPIALLERRHIKGGATRSPTRRAWRTWSLGWCARCSPTRSTTTTVMTNRRNGSNSSSWASIVRGLTMNARRSKPNGRQARCSVGQLLARYTGRRRGDISNMTRVHRKDGAIRVVQQKTSAELWVPEHRDLAAELTLSGGPGHMGLLTKPEGSAFDSTSLGVWFAEAIEEAGLPKACVMHGLRKTAARRLAEAGCSASQIASITAHRSLTEVERYTGQADQRRWPRQRFTD